MSATGPSSPPPTSAAVLEFICLFTHDLRRKQKRWQDGRLKYHTFNSRVMVYDDRGNFVGDMHWRYDWDLVEGEELQLERGGVIVQVQELSSRCEQDLSDLLDKRAKEKEQRQMQAVARTPNPSALPRTAVRPVVNRPIPADQPQSRHRPLHQVIGTPSGHHGRALVPKDSPFEQRHNAESPDDRAAKRRKYDAPPPSKSGYASALFGQALTLSATPMSSVPAVRRQITRERDSSPEGEDITTRIQREEPKPPLQERAKASRHFNQLGERSRPDDTAKHTRPKHHDVENDTEPPVRRKKERSLLSKPHSSQRKDPDPVDDDVIQIDDSDTPPVEEPVLPVPAEKVVAKRTVARKEKKAGPTAAATRQNSGPTSKRLNRFDDMPDEETEARDKISKTQEEPGHSKKTKTKTNMPKPAAKKTIADSSAIENIDEAQAVTLSSRNSSAPITELRIKSRKKRGLMMMSDLPKKSAGRPLGDSIASPAVAQSSKDMEVEATDNSFRSPSPRLHEGGQSRQPGQKSRSTFQHPNPGELENLEETIYSPSAKAHVESGAGALGRNGEARAQNGDLLELEEDDNPFRSPTPPLRAQTGTNGSKRNDKIVAERRISEVLGEDNDPFRGPSPVPATSPSVTVHQGAEDRVDDVGSIGPVQEEDCGATFQIDIEDVTANSIDNMVNIISSSPPHGKVYDPYRLPTSSPEEVSELRACGASSPKARTCPNTGRAKDSSSTGHPDGRLLVAKGKRMSKAKRAAKRPLAFLRNVVLDEDDEIDEPSEAIAQAEDGVEEASNSNSGANLAASETRRKSKERKSNLHAILDKEAIDSDADDGTAKKQVELKPATRASKRRSEVWDQDPDFESEDKQPAKRQRAIRKSRSRAAKSEENPLSSEQEDSEEASSKESRRKKIPKAPEDRPRLEKIKKSVKSREIIGFNVSALNAPVGLRKIGVPFSILSSAANESIQRRFDSHAAMEPTSGPLLDSVDERIPVATSDVLQMIAEADEMAVDKHSPGAGRSTDAPEPPTQPGEPTVSTGGYDVTRSKDSEQNSSLASLLFAPQTKETTATKDGTEERAEQTSTRPQQTSSSDTFQPATLTASLVSHEHETANEEKPTNVTAGLATSKLPQRSGCRASPIVEASTAIKPADDTNLTFPEGFAELAANEETASVIKGAVAKPFVLPPRKSTAFIQDYNLNNITSIASEDAPQEGDVGDIFEGRPAAPPTLPAFKRPEKKAMPALSRQSSHTADFTTEAGPSHSDDEAIAHKTAAEQVTEPVAESAKKPSPALRRQTSTFKPPTKAKLIAPQTDTGSRHQSDHPVPNIADKEPSKVQPSKLTRVLSRSDSAHAQVAEPDTVANGSDAAESPGVDQDLSLPVPREQRVGLQRTVSVTRRINNIMTALPQPALTDNPVPAESSTNSISNARIVNPASRGRKAAVKSDAKGPIPQRMLPPTQPFAMVPLSTADFASTPIEEPRKEPERPKKKMTFPGFQSARDEGPWSREAFDLLESGRPG